MPIVYWGGDIPDGDPILSAATPGLWNRRFSALSESIDFLNVSSFTAGGVFGTPLQVTVTASSATSNRISLPSQVSLTGTLYVTSTLTAAGFLNVGNSLRVGSTATFTEQVFSGTGGSVGGYAFTFSGTGMQQGSVGAVNFLNNGSPAVVGMGITSAGSMFAGPNAVSGSSTRFQINGTASAVSEAGSLDSTAIKSAGQFGFKVGASGVSFYYRSGSTIFWFDSSGSTKA